MRILKAEQADLNRVSQLFYHLHCLHVTSYPAIFKPISEVEASNILDELYSDKEAEILIASEESNLLGYVLFRKKFRKGSSLIKERSSMFVEQIYIDPQFRRRGVARLLLLEVEMAAKTSNIRSIELDVWASNNQALEFFRCSGYDVYNQLLSKQIAL